MKWRFLFTVIITLITFYKANSQVNAAGAAPKYVSIAINELDLKRHYFSLEFSTEAESQFRSGLSFAYSISPDRKRRYYLGAQLNMVRTENSRSINVYYQGFTTRNGDLTTSTETVTVNLTQQYYLGSNPAAIPFAFLNLGWCTAQNDLETSYYYDSGFPFGWVLNGDYVSQSASVYSSEIGFGYFIKFYHRQGIQIKLGLKNTGQFQILDKHSVRYDTQGIQYTTFQSYPVIITLKIGIAI